MKPGKSSLNPYAALYVPLSKREANDGDRSSVQTTEDSVKNETSCSNSFSEGHKVVQQNNLHPDESLDLNISGIEELLIGEDPKKKDKQNLNEHAENKYTDEECEVDLAYMAIMYPGVSEQSLVDVYSANGGDLEASLDMLNQLEPSPADVSKHLPDSLDIGDVWSDQNSNIQPGVLP